MSKNVFFVGIGGKGLNGIAQICLEKGYEVYGVDVNETKETKSLQEKGAKIFYGHSPFNINKTIKEVVYSSITKNAPEVLEAKKIKIKTTKRSEFLNQLTSNNFRISICGSHGKSTTVAIAGLSMINSGTDATIFGGAYTKEFKGYNHLGKSNYAILEACEYDRSFYDLTGNITIITSIEKSHLEYYKDEEEMLQAFKIFIDKHKPNATIIANGDDLNIRAVLANCKCKVIYFGFNSINNYVIKNIIKNRFGSNFSIYKNNKLLVSNLDIKIPGNYNIYNFASICALLDVLKIPLSGITETAKFFTGVGRRFEITEGPSGQIFVDDFAHHPTQVKYLFDGIKQFFPDKKICAIFQPRQFNLMRNFKQEYGAAFKLADEIIMTEILPALGDTEKDMKSITNKELVSSIENNSRKPVTLMSNFEDIVYYLNDHYNKDTVIATIGAGDIYKIRNQILK